MNWKNLPLQWFALCLLLFGAGPSALAAEEGSPNEVIASRAAALAEQLEGRQSYFAENNNELFTLVDELLLPGFDVRYASKLVLGKQHWTTASVQQRERFIAAFYGFLVRTYSKGLLGFDSQAMSIDPDATYSRDGAKALVRTTLNLAGGDSVKINFALRKGEGGWRIYDMRIDGVSYIQNYRSQFDAEISARGIDAVIQRLETEAADALRKRDASQMLDAA